MNKNNQTKRPIRVIKRASIEARQVQAAIVNDEPNTKPETVLDQLKADVKRIAKMEVY